MPVDCRCIPLRFLAFIVSRPRGVAEDTTSWMLLDGPSWCSCMYARCASALWQICSRKPRHSQPIPDSCTASMYWTQSWLGIVVFVLVMLQKRGRAPWDEYFLQCIGMCVRRKMPLQKCTWHKNSRPARMALLMQADSSYIKHASLNFILFPELISSFSPNVKVMQQIMLAFTL